MNVGFPCKCSAQLRKYRIRFVVIFPLIMLAACNSDDRPPLTIAAASSLRGPLEKLASRYEARTGDACRMIYGSSGKLTAQIMAGAPYDLFLAADAVYPDSLFRAGFALGPPRTFAYGQLIIWSLNAAVPADTNGLLMSTVKHVALPNPAIAPYGAAAKNYLERVGLWQQLQPKYVYGESVSQASQFVTSGAAELGFTALAVPLGLPENRRGSHTILSGESVPPIAQTLVIIRRDTDAQPGTQRFTTFLQTAEARAILQEFGYLTGAEPPRPE
ncbi:molybdate ABC transporter substrate-binding protein [Neolewinella antarctica]|uniref:Molybdate transport system substrate-binding protein n=1 Tax=Neolewinella antarctica TaxID=442734 RepID=A0ABX0X987_9BACT|nr:molybdate ABC transporter substrate-binding protein [Neolewinella antarctica]NJC25796.1 molybdate transport system substrate-binding protein [Neolewinella antarctica]